MAAGGVLIARDQPQPPRPMTSAPACTTGWPRSKQDKRPADPLAASCLGGFVDSTGPRTVSLLAALVPRRVRRLNLKLIVSLLARLVPRQVRRLNWKLIVSLLAASSLGGFRRLSQKPRSRWPCRNNPARRRSAVADLENTGDGQFDPVAVLGRITSVALVWNTQIAVGDPARCDKKSMPSHIAVKPR